MMMAVIFRNISFKCCFLTSRSLYISMKDAQDFPKTLTQLMERLHVFFV